MSSKVKYKGNVIAELNTNTSKTLQTGGTYCEADIVVENTPDGGITPSGEIFITENGTFDVTNFASALVNVSGGEGLEGFDIETGTFTLYQDWVVANQTMHNTYIIEHHLGKVPIHFDLMIDDCVNWSQNTINNARIKVNHHYSRNDKDYSWVVNEVYRANSPTGGTASLAISSSCYFPISEDDLPNQMLYADEHKIYLGNKHNASSSYQYILRAGNTYRWVVYARKEG